MKQLEITLGMCLVFAFIFPVGCSNNMQTKRSKEPEAPKDLTLDLGKGAEMKLVLIPTGEFLMGSAKTKTKTLRRADEGPQRGGQG